MFLPKVLNGMTYLINVWPFFFPDSPSITFPFFFTRGKKYVLYDRRWRWFSRLCNYKVKCLSGEEREGGIDE